MSEEILSTGIKKDQGKLDWDLLPERELEEVVKILTYAKEKKYGANNWQLLNEGNVHRLLSAIRRHYGAVKKAFETGTPELLYDEEHGYHHLASIVCDSMFLMWYINNQKISDDRYPIAQEKINNGAVSTAQKAPIPTQAESPTKHFYITYYVKCPDEHKRTFGEFGAVAFSRNDAYAMFVSHFDELDLPEGSEYESVMVYAVESPTSLIYYSIDYTDTYFNGYYGVTDTDVDSALSCLDNYRGASGHEVKEIGACPVTAKMTLSAIKDRK